MDEMMLGVCRPLANGAPVMITRWRVIELERFGTFIAGFAMHERAGRATSQILHWDYQARSATTRRGSRYVLLGPPGCDDDGMTIAGGRVMAVRELLGRKPRVIDRSAQVERDLAAEVGEYR